jgi:prophage antirepressor-like protein
MKELVKAFNGQELRVVIRNGVEWFVVKFVCDILGIVPADAIRNLRERYNKAGIDIEGVVTTHILETNGGLQKSPVCE